MRTTARCRFREVGCADASVPGSASPSYGGRTMSERNTVLRSMHDIGVAGWFGGSLMGAVGLNGAAGQAASPAERLQIASAGWDRWGPVNLAAIGAHLAEAAGILVSEVPRVATPKGVGAMSVAKTALTAAALGATVYRRLAGKRMEEDSLA